MGTFAKLSALLGLLSELVAESRASRQIQKPVETVAEEWPVMNSLVGVAKAACFAMSNIGRQLMSGRVNAFNWSANGN